MGFGVRSNSGRREKFTDRNQRKVIVLNCLQVCKLMLVSVYCICIFIEVLIDIKLMCESETVILSLFIILLTIIILLLLYLLSQKICLWEPTKLIQFFDRQNQYSISQNSQELRDTPPQLNGRNYRVRHIFRRRTPPPPKLNLPLINFGVINFCGSRPVPRLVDSGTTV